MSAFLRSDQRLQRRGHFAGQIGSAPEGDLGLASDESGRGEQQRRVLVVTDAPQVVEVALSEQDHVDIARRVARGGEVAKQPAGRFLEFVDAAACVDQHQLVAGAVSWSMPAMVTASAAANTKPPVSFRL